MADLTPGYIPVATGPEQADDGSLTDDTAGNIGGKNGVNLSIAAGTVTTVGTVGYSYGPNLNLNGGTNDGGYYGYGGHVIINGGTSTGATHNYQGDITLNAANQNFTAYNAITVSGAVIIQTAVGRVSFRGGGDIVLDAGASSNGIVLQPGSPGVQANIGTDIISGRLYVDGSNFVKQAP